MNRTIILFVIAIFYSNDTFSQFYKDNYNQFASMEFKQWNFTPKEYYYSWVKKKTLGITYHVPGLGIHDRGVGGSGIGGDGYVNQSWRRLTPLRAATLASTKSKTNNDNTIEEKWNEIAKRDLLEEADKNLDVAYSMTSSERNKYKDKINEKLVLLLKYDIVTTNNILLEYTRIKDNINIIQKSHLPNAKRIIAYNKENQNLKELNANLQMILKFTEIKQILK